MENLDQGSRLAQLKPRVFHRFLLLYCLCKLQPSGAFAQSTQTGPPSFPPLNGVEMDEDHPRRRGGLLTRNCCSKRSATVTVLGRDAGQAEEGGFMVNCGEARVL